MTEAWALTQAALRLRDAQQSKDPKEINNAARLNWQLWTIFQAELLDPGCEVPLDIRQNLLSLANFVDKHTLKIVSKPTPEMLDVLININREIAGGQFAEPGTTTAEDKPETPAAPSGTVDTTT
ncbi:MAG: flagellar biosynthesis regulator FlaF [Magnetospiraceae bacterium]